MKRFKVTDESIYVLYLMFFVATLVMERTRLGLAEALAPEYHLNGRF